MLRHKLTAPLLLAFLTLTTVSAAYAMWPYPRPLCPTSFTCNQCYNSASACAVCAIQRYRNGTISYPRLSVELDLCIAGAV